MSVLFAAHSWFPVINSTVVLILTGDPSPESERPCTELDPKVL